MLKDNEGGTGVMLRQLEEKKREADEGQYL